MGIASIGGLTKIERTRIPSHLILCLSVGIILDLLIWTSESRLVVVSGGRRLLEVHLVELLTRLELLWRLVWTLPVLLLHLLMHIREIARALVLVVLVLLLGCLLVVAVAFIFLGSGKARRRLHKGGLPNGLLIKIVRTEELLNLCIDWVH
jgi:hypothetical protein